ncbi:aminotransferase class IV [Pontibacter akesuensis]|uniref:aminotransferase class IV n=1 Tax=Pontibacter akesuensis TaxID=388950 RepID=UPI00083A309E|nr:aminotransferase class IV [Pontibacter akesuensis]GHA58880.1 aminotransferase class IV [Pontibacter akesuensis]
MFILYNGQQQQSEELRLPHSDRAFQYNDGFFETAIVQNGRIRFWLDHQQRMLEAANALQLELPDFFFAADFQHKLLQLAQQENAAAYGRLKLKVWRAGGGLYTPTTTAVNWLATVAPASPFSTKALHIGICQQVRTAYSSVSHFKGPNAPLYVLAGLEKQATIKEDMLLLSTEGYVAELQSSTIFWLLDEVLYTPDLLSGCVNGIVRRNILRWCAAQQQPVREVLQGPETLLQADVVFAANVTGIRGIASINGEPVQQNEAYLQQLRHALTLV